MGIGASLFLMALGAILAWAVPDRLQGIDLNVVGIILLIIGALGMVLSLLFWSSFSPYGRRETVVRETDAVPVGDHHHHA
jgi:uncharacterized protein DUF6458